MTFEEVLMECARDKTLVAEFDRLTGHNLSIKGAGIERMIDDTTGRTEEGIKDFIAFVHETVWLPLRDGQKAE